MLFSVIVPIYNIEKYLQRCIDSALNQTFADFELILVDDGSPDNCPAICDEYAEKDERIKVIHKKNGGLVSARQAGIKIATGDYIFNLDGDDALCEDALESASKIINEYHPDMVSFSHIRYVDDKICDVAEDIAEEGFYTKPDIERSIYPLLLSDKNMQNLFYFIWAKAIKRELAAKHQLNVSTAISHGEDVSCTVPLYLDAESLYMSKKAIYLYTIRTDSLTNNFKTSQITQIADTIKGLRSSLVDKPPYFDEQIARYSCFMCFAMLALAAETNQFPLLDEIKRLILNSLHREEIKKARFENITAKSRIAIYLMKKEKIKLAFYFLYLCKKLKCIRKGGNQ